MVECSTGDGGVAGLFDLNLYVQVNNFLSYVRTGLPGLNQYLARIIVSCSRTQHYETGKARDHSPSVLSHSLPLSHCATSSLIGGTVLCP